MTGGVFLKYGIKSILRTPLKTILFLVLILLVTIVLSVGTGMLQSAESMLALADETFVTAGEISFTGGYDYAGELVEPPAWAEVETAARQKGVKILEESRTARATVEGFAYNREPIYDAGVLIVSMGAYVPTHKAYTCFVVEDWYSFAGQQDKMIHVGVNEGNNGERYTLEPYHYYLVHGTFGMGASQIPLLNPKPYSELEAYDVGVSSPPSVIDITEYVESGTMDAFRETEAAKFYANAAEMYRVVNNSIDIVGSEDVAAVEAFHLGGNVLSEGGLFSEEHYKTGDVCIVSVGVLDRLGLALGDSITFHIEPRPPDERNRQYANYWPEPGYAATETLTIVGVYRNDNPNDYTVYVPYAGQPWLSHYKYDTVIGRVELDNAYGYGYLKAVGGALPPTVSLTINDQGYAAAAGPINSMRETAVLLTAITMAAALVVLLLFAFIFVSRNKESVLIMLSLGAGPGRVRKYLFSGCGLIAAAASAIGLLISRLITDNIVAQAYQSALENSLYDTRFSILGSGIKSSSFEAMVSTRTNPLIAVLTALGIIALALLLVFLFSQAVIRTEQARRKEIVPRKRKKAKAVKQRSPKRIAKGSAINYVPGASLRYALRSIVRGGARSLAIPLVFMALLILISLFAGLRGGYQAKLDSVYEDVPVIMYRTDVRGRYHEGVRVSDIEVEELEATGFIQKASHARNGKYHYGGLLRRASGEYANEAIEPMPKPTSGSSYSEETFQSRISKLFSPFVYTNDMAQTPEFMRSSAPEITYMPNLSVDPDNPMLVTLDGDYYVDWQEFALSNNLDEYMFTTVDYNKLPADVQAQLDTFNETMNMADYPEMLNEIYAHPEEYAEYYEKYAPSPQLCFMPTTLLDLHGLRLGDIVQLNIYGEESYGEPGSDKYYPARNLFLIAGSFVPKSNKGYIYCYEAAVPAGYYYELDTSTEDAGSHTYVEVRQPMMYDSAVFMLQNTERLSEFKDILSGQYAHVGKLGSVRKWVVIDDAALYDTIRSLNRHILYMNLLYPVVLILAAAIGFFVASLLLKSRQEELAVMRSVGAGRRRVFVTFLTEQLLLCIPGAALGIGISLLVLKSYDKALWLNVALFALCYFVGGALAIFRLNRQSVMKNLQAKEE